MMASLGFSEKSTTIVLVKDEFTLSEMLEYFKAATIDITLPDWLPRRPLICHTIAQLEDAERDDMFGVGNNEAAFWNYFIEIVCKRDARINASFDANTIYEVFVTLAGETRNKPGDVGPINQRELQDAFEGVVGKLPVEDAAIMLQRLPSLGRVSPESSDRQFIDAYILDGLRAHHIHRLVSGDEEKKRKVANESWSNPLQVLGQKVAASKSKGQIGGYINLAKLGADQKNRTLAADIVLGLGRLGNDAPKVDKLVISDATISELNPIDGYCDGVTFEDCTIEQVETPSSPPRNLKVKGSLIGRLVGASSIAGLGDWISQNDIEHFDSVRTTSRIRDAGLPEPLEFLATVIKKTFFQPGNGRKEEALTRGLSGNTLNKIAPKVLNLLVREGVLTHFKGKDGIVYAPNRSAAGRMQKMLDELRSSTDPVWLTVSSL